MDRQREKMMSPVPLTRYQLKVEAQKLTSIITVQIIHIW